MMLFTKSFCTLGCEQANRTSTDHKNLGSCLDHDDGHEDDDDDLDDVDHDDDDG